MTVPEITSVVSEWCAGKPFVNRAWLIGSRARGDNRPDSDIDIAMDVSGIVKDESGYSAFFHEHESWEKEIQERMRLPLHLCHYNDTPERIVDQENADIKAATDKEGILLYDASVHSLAMRSDR